MSPTTLAYLLGLGTGVFVPIAAVLLWAVGVERPPMHDGTSEWRRVRREGRR